mgnify:CR=1 FL=1
MIIKSIGKNKRRNLPITLVCTTHNRPQKLFNLLNSIEKNLFKPEQIIIVGTSLKDFSMINNKKYSLNLKKIISKKKNQIFQRNLGISYAKSTLLAQCDDDLLLDRNFFINMYKNFQVNLNKKFIVGSKILTSKYNVQSERWNYAYDNHFLFRSVLMLLNNFKKIKDMSLLSSGRIAPKLPLEFRKDSYHFKLSKVEWLSSTLCYNLKRINKIDVGERFNNQSYFEDVNFTHYNYTKGFKLILDSRVLCYHPIINETNFQTYRKTVRAQWKLVNTFKKSKILFYLDVIIFGLIFFFKDLLRKF